MKKKVWSSHPFDPHKHSQLKFFTSSFKHLTCQYFHYFFHKTKPEASGSLAYAAQ